MTDEFGPTKVTVAIATSSPEGHLVEFTTADSGEKLTFLLDDAAVAVFGLTMQSVYAEMKRRLFTPFGKENEINFRKADQ